MIYRSIEEMERDGKGGHVIRSAEQLKRKRESMKQRKDFQAEVERLMEKERQRQKELEHNEYGNIQQRYDLGTATDQKIIRYIQSGKVDEYIGFSLKYNAEHIMYNIDMMCKQVAGQTTALDLYATSGTGMSQAYMKDFVSALWLIKCVGDKIMNSNNMLFEGVKGRVKSHSKNDNYVYDLMKIVMGDKGKTKSNPNHSSEESVTDNDAIIDLSKRMDTIEKKVDVLEVDNDTTRKIVRGIKNMFTDADEEMEEHHLPEEAAPLLSNNGFMEVMQKAEKAGFVEPHQWQFIWKGSDGKVNKRELAYFAETASDSFQLGNTYNKDGSARTSWEPFEALFKVKKGELRLVMNDMNKTGNKPRRWKEIDALFK